MLYCFSICTRKLIFYFFSVRRVVNGEVHEHSEVIRSLIFETHASHSHQTRYRNRQLHRITRVDFLPARIPIELTLMASLCLIEGKMSSRPGTYRNKMGVSFA
jgi:hypothetical protein